MSKEPKPKKGSMWICKETLRTHRVVFTSPEVVTISEKNSWMGDLELFLEKFYPSPANVR